MFDRGIGNCERSAAAERTRIHPKNFLACRDQSAAGKSGIEGQVRPDKSVQLASTKRMPLAHDTGENARACHQIAAPSSANGDDQLANRKLRLFDKAGVRTNRLLN